MPYLIARISNPYGGGIVEPGREQGLIPVVLRKLITDDVMEAWVPHSTTRDYIHADDFAIIINRLIENDITDETFNIASGIGISNGEIYKLCENIMGKQLKLSLIKNKTATIPRNVLSINKLKEIGCSSMTISFADGVKELAAKIATT